MESAPHPSHHVPAEGRLHDAFISYSRKDAAFVLALRTSLERHRIEDAPFDGRRLSVFVDTADLASSAYYDEIDRQLAGSRTLVVVCSPDARRSPYVRDEIQRFLKHHDAQRIVPVLVAGDANHESSDEARWALPDELVEAMRMPVYADYRGLANLSMRGIESSAFASARYAILAGVTGLPRRVLERRDEKRKRTLLYRALGGTATVAAAFAAALVVAMQSRQEAIAQRNNAEAKTRELAAASIARELESNESMAMDDQLLLAALGQSIHRSTRGLGALLTVNQRFSHFKKNIIVPGIGPDGLKVRSMAMNADGSFVVVLTPSKWMLLSVDSGKLVLERDAPDFDRIDYVADKVVAAFRSKDGEVKRWRTDGAEMPMALTGARDFVALPHEGAFVVRAKDDRLELWDAEGTSTLDRSRASLPESQLSVDFDASLVALQKRTRHAFQIKNGRLVPGQREARPEPADDDYEDAPLILFPSDVADRLDRSKNIDVSSRLRDLRLRKGDRGSGLQLARLQPFGSELLMATWRNGSVIHLNMASDEKPVVFGKRYYDGRTGENRRTPVDLAWAGSGDVYAVAFYDGEIWVIQPKRSIANHQTLMLDTDAYIGLCDDQKQLCARNPDGTFHRLRFDGGYLRMSDREGVAEASPPADAEDIDGSLGESADGRVRLTWKSRRAKGVNLTYDSSHAHSKNVYLYRNGEAQPKTITLGWHGMPLTSSVAADGSYAAIGFEDGTLHIVDLRTGDTTRSPVPSAYANSFRSFSDLIFNSDGSALYAFQGPQLMMWRFEKGLPVASSYSPATRPHALQLSADGQMLFLLDERGAVTLYDPKTLRPVSISVPMLDPGSAKKARLLLTDSHVVAVDPTERISLLPINAELLLKDTCARVGRDFREMQYLELTSGVKFDSAC